jgi:hypothetical protein
MKKIKKDIETGEISNEQQAAKVLLDEGVKFKIKGLGSYEIKPLKLCTLVEISKDALQVESISESNSNECDCHCRAKCEDMCPYCCQGHIKR